MGTGLLMGGVLTRANGVQMMLVACEQRTLISWLESIDMMLASMAASPTRGALGQASSCYISE